MVGAAAVIFSSSAHCARPTAADAWLHWQVPLQRGWVVVVVVVAAAVVLGLPVDLDRGFGVGCDVGLDRSRDRIWRHCRMRGGRFRACLGVALLRVGFQPRWH